MSANDFTITLPSGFRIVSPSATGLPAKAIRILSPSGEVIFSAHANEFPRNADQVMARLVAKLRRVLPTCESLERGGALFALPSGCSLFMWPDCVLFRGVDGNEEPGAAWFAPEFRRAADKVLTEFLIRIGTEFRPAPTAP